MVFFIDERPTRGCRNLFDRSDQLLYGAATSSPITLSVYTTAAAILNAASSLASNEFQVKVSGLPGFDYIIETSTNLINWEPAGTNVAPFTFTDPMLDGFPVKFYRAVYLR